jgi:amino acid transporter
LSSEEPFVEREADEGPGEEAHLEAGADLQSAEGEEEAEPPHHGGHRHVKLMPEPGNMSTNSPVAEGEREARPEQGPPPLKVHKVHPHLREEIIVKGSHPGDRYVRYGRNVGPFKRKSGGVLAASLAADQPRGRWGRAFGRIKRTLIGLPISSEHSIHERLTNAKALAVLSSDALSSVAYATEEILRILIPAGATALTLAFLPAGTTALWLALPIGLAIILLMVVVVASYRQTIAAYPRGGGSYIVAKDNLGTLPGLIAASSILIGYILTVAVSISAGVFALYSLFPALEPVKVEVCVVLVALITIANMRGVREAGNIFAVPTYLFIVGILVMIAYGLARLFLGIGGEMVYHPPPAPAHYGTVAIDLWLILKAFTQGSAALTGVEAIADGVPAFKPPEAKNARITITWMAVLAIAMFAGITFLAVQLKIQISDKESVVSQLARTVFGDGPIWYFINIATTMILVLAANTAFSDFPRLSYFLARDRFMPHQYAFRGDRLAFSWGIVTLAALACILIIAFSGDTTALIPLYAVGVFSAFTFSQGGMVARWWRLRTPGWWRNLLMNGLGALTTATVFAVATFTKLEQGTWIVIAVIPVQIAIFMAINRHYKRFDVEAEAVIPLNPGDVKHTLIVPVAKLNNVARSALAYARSITPNVTAVHIAEGEDNEEVELFNEAWHKLMEGSDIALVIIESPYRSLVGPLLSYIDALDRQSPDDTITIVVPELLPAKPWEYLLHNQTALRLKAALLFRPNTVVSNIPYVIGRRSEMRAPGARGSPRLAPWVALLGAAVLLALYLLFLKP